VNCVQIYSDVFVPYLPTFFFLFSTTCFCSLLGCCLDVGDEILWQEVGIQIPEAIAFGDVSIGCVCREVDTRKCPHQFNQ